MCSILSVSLPRESKRVPHVPSSENDERVAERGLSAGIMRTNRTRRDGAGLLVRPRKELLRGGAAALLSVVHRGRKGAHWLLLSPVEESLLMSSSEDGSSNLAAVGLSAERSLWARG